MEPAKPHYVTVSGGQIRIWRRGEGPDLVVLGGLTLAAEALANRVAGNCPGWRVTAIETPGVGGSTAASGADLKRMSAAQADAIRVAGIASFVLLGHELSAAFLEEVSRQLPGCELSISIGAARVSGWARAVGSSLDLKPRQDGSHLTMLWHHLRDRELLVPDNISMPARSGDLISSVEEASLTFVAAATDIAGYANTWSVCLENAGQEAKDVHRVETLADVPAELSGLNLQGQSNPLPPTAPLPDGAIWNDYVQTSRGLVHLRRSGDTGTPLLVIPTGGGSSAQFAPVVKGLSRGRQAFSVDYFGNGLSEKLDRDVTVEMLAADAAAVIEALGFERVDVWGSHTGALVGIELAVSRPELVRKAVLEGPVFVDPAFQTDLLDNYFPRIDADRWGLHLQLVWHWRRDMFMYWPWYRVDRATARDLGVPVSEDIHLYAVGILESGRTYDQAYRSAFKYDTANRLPLLKRPALVCAGPNDMLVNGVAETEKLAVPGVETLLTPTTVWWPAPEPEASAATLAIYDAYLRDDKGV